ncbi:hypothetical protein SB49_06800 [Sediminicola sp. YIK13]|uniref:DUF2752 domain-containing protein n=1 Tax=Sediminicola sp. YIK13 TaxID=1453352 RepID=UPI000721DD32|nr:DUF2752 domain-containing protein [Sediminicola sp. YIK13]ALM07542.1 hypothetical protein SB49_06800 [Sediminicola sp. YIK13]
MKILPFLLLFSLDDFMLPCLNKKLLGIECPGCGLQRAIALIFKGEFREAFLMYPAIYPLIPLLGFLLVNNFYPVKHANKIIIALTATTISLIITNFIFKL